MTPRDEVPATLIHRVQVFDGGKGRHSHLGAGRRRQINTRYRHGVTKSKGPELHHSWGRHLGC